MRKPLMALAIVACLVILHEALLLFALYLMAAEFETGRALVKGARRRWPFLSRLVARAHGSRWAPRALGEFDDLTNPAK